VRNLIPDGRLSREVRSPVPVKYSELPAIVYKEEERDILKKAAAYFAGDPE
jgi:transposase-like protein